MPISRPKECDEPKKGFLFQKLEEVDFILRMTETVGFAQRCIGNFFPAGTLAQNVIRPRFVTSSYFCRHVIISCPIRLSIGGGSRGGAFSSGRGGWGLLIFNKPTIKIKTHERV